MPLWRRLTKPSEKYISTECTTAKTLGSLRSACRERETENHGTGDAFISRSEAERADGRALGSPSGCGRRFRGMRARADRRPTSSAPDGPGNTGRDGSDAGHPPRKHHHRGDERERPAAWAKAPDRRRAIGSECRLHALQPDGKDSAGAPERTLRAAWHALPRGRG